MREEMVNTEKMHTEKDQSGNSLLFDIQTVT